MLIIVALVKAPNRAVESRVHDLQPIPTSGLWDIVEGIAVSWFLLSRVVQVVVLGLEGILSLVPLSMLGIKDIAVRIKVVPQPWGTPTVCRPLQIEFPFVVLLRGHVVEQVRHPMLILPRSGIRGVIVAVGQHVIILTVEATVVLHGLPQYSVVGEVVAAGVRGPTVVVVDHDHGLVQVVLSVLLILRQLVHHHSIVSGRAEVVAGGVH